MPSPSRIQRTVASILLVGAVAASAIGLAIWKGRSHDALAKAASSQPEPREAVEAAEVSTRQFARSTTSIGTVRALHSITLRNELPGTVQRVDLQTGQVVEAGALLVELDVTVEQAELAALQAEAQLAASMLGRMEQALQSQGASAADVDRARAEHDKALAHVTRTRALIERKRLRSPFRARVGLVDLHVGQYLDAGATITSLQGLDEAVHVDFAVTQDTAALLALGIEVEVEFTGRPAPAKAAIVAIDALVETATRNMWIRALLKGGAALPQPGASVRVRTPVETPHEVVVVPTSALRRGPAGDHVFVLQTASGATRATTRRVKSGPAIGDDIIITSGLKVGERVATTGSFKLREGVLVDVAAPVRNPAEKPQ